MCVQENRVEEDLNIRDVVREVKIEMVRMVM